MNEFILIISLIANCIFIVTFFLENENRKRNEHKIKNLEIDLDNLETIHATEQRQKQRLEKDLEKALKVIEDSKLKETKPAKTTKTKKVKEDK